MQWHDFASMPKMRYIPIGDKRTAIHSLSALYGYNPTPHCFTNLLRMEGRMEYIDLYYPKDHEHESHTVKSGEHESAGDQLHDYAYVVTTPTAERKDMTVSWEHHQGTDNSSVTEHEYGYADDNDERPVNSTGADHSKRNMETHKTAARRNTYIMGNEEKQVKPSIRSLKHQISKNSGKLNMDKEENIYMSTDHPQGTPPRLKCLIYISGVIIILTAALVIYLTVNSIQLNQMIKGIQGRLNAACSGDYRIVEHEDGFKSYLRLNKIKANYTDAKAFCGNNSDGELVTAETAWRRENLEKFVTDNFKEEEVEYIFIGAQEVVKEDTFYWDGFSEAPFWDKSNKDSHPEISSSWDIGEPDDFNQNESCVCVLTNGKWHDCKCFNAMRMYICEVRSFEYKC